VRPFPFRDVLPFSFQPVTLDPAKRYGLRFQTDLEPSTFKLFLGPRTGSRLGAMFQGGLPIDCTLALRLDGLPSPAGSLRAMGAGDVKALVSGPWIMVLVIGLLCLGGLIAGTAARLGIPKARMHGGRHVGRPSSR
jgi:hypothetical protein